MGIQRKIQRIEEGGSFEAPAIHRDPVNRRVKLGAKVVLRVHATGRPLPTYQWFHNGKKIADAEGDQLEIEKVRRLSAGSYHCEVKNLAGKAVSKACMITVITQEIPAIVVEPRESAVEEGRPQTLRVVSPGTDALRGLQIYWTFNGTRIPGARGTELFIANATNENQGEYKAMVSIGSSIESSNVARIEIKSAAAAGEEDFLTQGSMLLAGVPTASAAGWDVFDPSEDPLLSELGTRELVKELELIEEMPNLLTEPVDSPEPLPFSLTEAPSESPETVILRRKREFLERFLHAWQNHRGKGGAKAA